MTEVVKEIVGIFAALFFIDLLFFGAVLPVPEPVIDIILGV